jgi:hypothetical protein
LKRFNHPFTLVSFHKTYPCMKHPEEDTTSTNFGRNPACALVKFRRRVNEQPKHAQCAELDATTLKVSYDIIWRRGRFDSTLFDLLALAPPPPRSSMSPGRNLRHLRSTGGCRGHQRPAGGHVRLFLSLSHTLVSITHSLITAGRSLEASSFCQNPVECARISLWAASGAA